MQDELTETQAAVGADEDDDLAHGGEVAQPLVAADAESAAQYKDRLKQELKTRADMFEDMVQHEEAVRLGETGWKARYYSQKFGIESGPDQQELIQAMSTAFVEGLCWVMRYYFEGVASWRWYYPFHYAPFASDLVRLGEMQVRLAFAEFVTGVCASHECPEEMQVQQHEHAFHCSEAHNTPMRFDAQHMSLHACVYWMCGCTRHMSWHAKG
jgi:hypothetical protein